MPLPAAPHLVDHGSPDEQNAGRRQPLHGNQAGELATAPPSQNGECEGTYCQRPQDPFPRRPRYTHEAQAKAVPESPQAGQACSAETQRSVLRHTDVDSERRGDHMTGDRATLYHFAVVLLVDGHMKGDATPRRAIELWQTGETSELLSHFPEMAAEIVPVQDRLDSIAAQAATDFAENWPRASRKDFAMAVKDRPWSAVLFRMLTDGSTAGDAKAIMRRQSLASLERMVGL